jgi:hypothetical protein
MAEGTITADGAASEEPHVITGTEAFLSHWTDSNDIWRLVFTLFSNPLVAMRDAGFTAPVGDDFYAALDSQVDSVWWLRKNERIITEMVLCRIVDVFLTYFSDLLRLILVAQPNALLSERGTVDLRRVMSASSLDELKKELVDDRILALSYKSVADLAHYLEERLGFVVFSDPAGLSLVVKIVETRNLFVHNRGITNDRYFERTGRLPGEEPGHRLRIRPSDLLRFNSFFDGLVKKIDTTSAEKFTLPLLSRTIPRPRDMTEA